MLASLVLIQVLEILGDFLNIRLYRHLRPILDMDISSHVGPRLF